MIDIATLRKDPEKIRRLKDKDPNLDVDRLLDLDEKRRSLLQEIEQLRSEKNDLAKKAQSGITDEVRKKSIAQNRRSACYRRNRSLKPPTGSFRRF